MILLQVYGSQGGECGSLNVIDKLRFIGNGTIKRCDFAGIGMTLLEELYHCGGGLFGLIYFKSCLVSQFTSCCLHNGAKSSC